MTNEYKRYSPKELYVIPITKVTSIDLENNKFKHKKIWYGIFIKDLNGEYLHLSSGLNIEQINSRNIKVGQEGIYAPYIKEFDVFFNKTKLEYPEIIAREWSEKDLELLENKLNDYYELKL